MFLYQLKGMHHHGKHIPDELRGSKEDVLDHLDGQRARLTTIIKHLESKLEHKIKGKEKLTHVITEIQKIEDYTPEKLKDILATFHPKKKDEEK